MYQPLLFHVFRWGVAAALLVTVGTAQAQTMRRIGAATLPAAPVTQPGAAPFALPNPAGLNSAFPAGLPAPVGAVSTTPGTTAADAGLAVVPGAAASAAYGGGARSQSAPAPVVATNRYTAVDYARAFIEADTNRDGQLTRAEAARLPIMPASIEEMDRNHDGVITRFEYDDATR